MLARPAGPLAEGGYEVQVVDPVPEHVAEAASLPGVSATLGDARALPAADRSADAVLLLGPLYHLVDRTDRVAAWEQAAGLRVHRVVAVEGPLWISGPRLDDMLADTRMTALLLDMLRKVEADPSLLGASSHLLTVAGPRA